MDNDTEEDISMTPEDQHPDDQNKNDTAQEDDKGSDDKSYQDYGLFSEDDYEGFAFLQDVKCNMNCKWHKWKNLCTIYQRCAKPDVTHIETWLMYQH